MDQHASSLCQGGWARHGIGLSLSNPSCWSTVPCTVVTLRSSKRSWTPPHCQQPVQSHTPARPACIPAVLRQLSKTGLDCRCQSPHPGPPSHVQQATVTLSSSWRSCAPTCLISATKSTPAFEIPPLLSGPKTCTCTCKGWDKFSGGNGRDERGSGLVGDASARNYALEDFQEDWHQQRLLDWFLLCRLWVSPRAAGWAFMASIGDANWFLMVFNVYYFYHCLPMFFCCWFSSSKRYQLSSFPCDSSS